MYVMYNLASIKGEGRDVIQQLIGILKELIEAEITHVDTCLNYVFVIFLLLLFLRSLFRNLWLFEDYGHIFLLMKGSLFVFLHPNKMLSISLCIKTTFLQAL